VLGKKCGACPVNSEAVVRGPTILAPHPMWCGETIPECKEKIAHPSAFVERIASNERELRSRSFYTFITRKWRVSGCPKGGTLDEPRRVIQ